METTKDKYKQGHTIKFETESIKSSLLDYSDVFILVTGNITVTENNNIDVAFKNCAPFSTCKTAKVTEVKWFISIVLVLNMFLKKLKSLLGTKA